MKMKIKGIYNVLKREIGQIIGDLDLVTILLLSPLFYAFFYCSVYVNKTENSVPIAVVDMDRSTTSSTFTRHLDSHQNVDVKFILPDYAGAVDKMYKGEIQGIVFLPEGFSGSLKSGHGTDLKLYLNTSRFLISNDINKAINEVAGTYSAMVRLKYFEAQGYNFEQARELIEPVQSEAKSLFNPTESYGDFLIPGLLVLILQQTLIMGLSESVAKEREEGTLSNLYSTANKSIWATITGKGIFYFILYSAYAFMFYVVHFSIFNISFRGSVFATLVLTALFLISIIYLSIFISSFFNRKIVSLQVIAFTSYPVFLISGYPWPMQAMPGYIKAIAQILPSTPYLNAFGRITQMGAGFADVMPEFYHLAILALLGLIVTRIRIKNVMNYAGKKAQN